MYVEVLRVDSKGRITIPAYMRLVLGIEPNSKVVAILDEERKVIELRVTEPGALFLCVSESVDVSELEALVHEYASKLVSINCVRSDKGSAYCRIVTRDEPIELEGFMCRSLE